MSLAHQRAFAPSDTVLPLRHTASICLQASNRIWLVFIQKSLLVCCSGSQKVSNLSLDGKETPENALIPQTIHYSVKKKSPTPVGINRFNIMKRGAAGCVWLLLAWCTAASSLRSGIIHLLCYTDLETFHSRRSDYRSHSEPHRAGCAFYDLWRYCVSASQFQLFVFNKNQTQLTLSNFSCLDIRLLMDVSVLVPTWGEVYELLTHTCGCQ